jgi:hypothetical protein
MHTSRTKLSLVFFTVLALLAVATSAAMAEQKRIFQHAFGCPTAGVEGCTVADPYPIPSPGGVAVDEKTHDVYVTDRSNARVEKFNAKGEFVLMFGEDVNKTKEGGLPSEADVCDPEKELPLVVECQAGTAGATPGAFANSGIMFLAVDNSSGSASRGDVYVADEGDGIVTKFTEDGAVVSTWGDDGPGESANGQLVPDKELESDRGATGTGTIVSGENNIKSVTTVPGGEFRPGQEISGPGIPVGTKITGLEVGGSFLYISQKATASGTISLTARASFGELSGIAVDASGDLWVDGTETEGQYQQLFEFDPEAKLETAWIPHIVFPGLQGSNALSRSYYGIAVDSGNNLYLKLGSERGAKLGKFSASGVFIGMVAGETTPGTKGTTDETWGVAVDAAGAVYVDSRLNMALGETLSEGIDVYVGCQPPPREFELCAPTELFAANRPPGPDAQLAVDSASAGDTVFAARNQSQPQVLAFSLVTVPAVSTGKPSAVSVGSVTLNGSVNPSGVALEEGEAGCRFEWGLVGAAYEHSVECAQKASAIGSGTSEVPVDAVVGGLEKGKTYHYRVVAENAGDVQEPSLGGDVVFGPPVVGGEWAFEVASSVAGVRAEVDPRNVDTRVRVEYGTTTEYGQQTGVVDVGAGAGLQRVSFELQGLAPGTEYYYRFVAENALGEGKDAAVGADRSFKTQGAGAFRLPDGRAWELVSPRDRHGASIEPLNSSYDTGGEIQAAGDGDGISYVTNLPVEAGVDGFPEFAQVLSRRTGSGWVSSALSVPHAESLPTGTSVTEGREYRLFSEDLSEAAVQPTGAFESCTSALGVSRPCLSPEASEQTAFVQDLGSGVFTPLVTGCLTEAQYEKNAAEGKQPTHCEPAVAEHENVPPGTSFGTTEPCPPIIFCGPQFEDATGDFSHVVVDSPVRLTEEPGATAGLYEWSAGKLAFVGAGSIGAAHSHPVSEDGSRVFWTGQVFNPVTHNPESHLYMRDMTSGEVLPLDLPEAECVAQGKCAAAGGGGAFQDASSEGDRVFFTDAQPLTLDSGAGAEKPDLYECEIGEVAGKPKCNLKDLTPANGTESAGTPPTGAGGIIGASEDGSYVYFVANGVLGDGAQHGATPGDCKGGEGEAPDERCNLYVSHEGATRLVAVLSGMDIPDWGGLYPYGPTARVSPNGQWLAFMSDRSLTGYDNEDASSKAPGERMDEEVYLYDASTEHLVCASCDPTGARPDGRRYGDQDGNGIENSLVGGLPFPLYSDTWLAANIPTWTPQSYHNAVYQSRYLSDNGRLFFNTSDGLVPKDGNNQEDVYEYEPEGAGSEPARCGPSVASGSEVYKPAQAFESEPLKEGEQGPAGEEGAGCVALISSGTSGQESAFMEASAGGGEGEHGEAGSEGGRDVFFLTAAHLVGGEIENGESLYDAHECTVSSPCTQEAQAPPECETAEACRAAPEPQPGIYQAPASATFNGKANPTPEAPPAKAPAKKVTKKTAKCRKGFIKNKHGKCVRKPKPKKHGKAKR